MLARDTTRLLNLAAWNCPADPLRLSPSETTMAALLRELRTLELLVLGTSAVIGTGAFMLPGQLAALLGPAAILALLIAAACCLLIVLCFAEIASRFEQTGGSMLYCRAAFGDRAGFLVGGASAANRIVAWASIASAFVLSLDGLGLTTTGWRRSILLGLFIALAVVNSRGLRAGAGIANGVAAIRILPVLILLAAGLPRIDRSLLRPFAPHGLGALLPASKLALYVFVGFEGLVIPAGETRQPRHSMHRALLLTIAIATVIATALWLLAAGTCAELAGSENPIARAAEGVLGGAGAWLVGLAIALSVLGSCSAAAIVAPRSLFSLAEQGYLPAFLAQIHATRHSPVPAIVLTSALSLGVALSGTFTQLASLSVAARFFEFIPTCLAVPVLRRRQRRADGSIQPALFRLPLGPVIPLLATATCLCLLWASAADVWLWAAAGIGTGLIYYQLTCTDRSAPPRQIPPVK